GGRHLRHLRAPASTGHRHQSPAARRTHGLRALAGPDLHRAVAEGRKTAAAGAVVVDAEHRRLVSPAPCTPRRSDVSREGKSGPFATHVAPAADGREATGLFL